MASIMAGHVTLLTARASKAEASKVKDTLEQEVLKAIKESQKNEEDNSKN